MKEGHYRYQMRQLTWTIMSVGLVVLQTSRMNGNVVSGLFWFLLPVSLIVCNDSCAYFVGLALGNKLVNKPFLALSPRKTWEGFLGGSICTVILAAVVTYLTALFAGLLF